MKIRTNTSPLNAHRPLSVIEVAILQASDATVTERYRGAPILKAYGPAEFLRMPIAEVTHKDFEPVLANYRMGRPARDTGYRLVSDFNALMLWATKHNHRPRPHNPYPLPNRQSELLELLSADEMSAVILASDKLFRQDISIAISIRAMALLGLGVTDTCTFSLDKVDLKRWEYIHSDNQGRHRIIPIPHTMRALLAKAHNLRPADECRKDSTFRALSDQTLRNLVKRIGQHIGMPNLVPVQLIRTCLHGIPIVKNAIRTGVSHV